MGILEVTAYLHEHSPQRLEKGENLDPRHQPLIQFLNVLETLRFEMSEHHSLYDEEPQSLLFHLLLRNHE